MHDLSTMDQTQFFSLAMTNTNAARAKFNALMSQHKMNNPFSEEQ